MGSCSGIETGLHSTYKDKWGFVGKEQNGRLWMENCSEETSGGRRNSGYIDLTGFLLKVGQGGQTSPGDDDGRGGRGTQSEIQDGHIGRGGGV